mgnify:FL=1
MHIYGRKIFSDKENPITIFYKLKSKFKDISILESVIGGENKGRYSIIFFNIIENIEIYENYAFKNKKKIKISSPNNFLKEISKLNKVSNHYDPSIPIPFLIGNMCFDLSKFTLPKLKYNLSKNQIHIPLAHVLRPTNLIIFDNILNETHLIEIKNKAQKNQNFLKKIEKLILSNEIDKFKEKNKMPSKFYHHMKKSDFFKKVNSIKKEISKGEIFQAVLSQRFSSNYKIDPFKFYRALRSINPSPYLVYLDLKEYQIICSSPETMINVKNRQVTLRPIAGTRKRGITETEDLKLKNDLLNDTKELAEHLMLVDLGRNDVGQISKDNSVKVTEKNIIEYYSHVMHIVSNVTGILKNGLSPMDVLYAGLPAGTVSGAPKIRALEILEEQEDINREFYSGSVFYLDINGDMDSCINLRTALIKNNKIYAQSGAGIVHDSKPEKEYIECINKANALFKAYEIAHKIT